MDYGLWMFTWDDYYWDISRWSLLGPFKTFLQTMINDK